MQNDPGKAGRAGVGHLVSGGELGERIRAFDWSKLPLGAIVEWPPSLRTMIAVMLGGTAKSVTSAQGVTECTVLAFSCWFSPV